MTTKINSISSKTRQRLTSLLCVSILLSIAWWQSVSAEPQPAEILAIYFTPPAGGAGGLIKHIDGSKKTIKVMAYGFTAMPLSDALIKAHRRGVKVQLLQDEKSAGNNSDAVNQLIAAGIEVRSDGKHAIQHNKVMLMDDDIVITGSYNFTKSAEVRNAENIIILKSAYAAKRYADNWDTHWKHGEEVSDKPSKKNRN
jgi:phosphatidylserine/phosphatidylglycerophosphate/cardiolipin synthase-like enzyme